MKPCKSSNSVDFPLPVRPQISAVSPFLTCSDKVLRASSGSLASKRARSFPGYGVLVLYAADTASKWTSPSAGQHSGGDKFFSGSSSLGTPSCRNLSLFNATADVCSAVYDWMTFPSISPADMNVTSATPTSPVLVGSWLAMATNTEATTAMHRFSIVLSHVWSIAERYEDCCDLSRSSSFRLMLLSDQPKARIVTKPSSVSLKCLLSKY